MNNFPQRFKNYPQSGPSGQHHLALFEENRLSAGHAFHNKKFIRILTISLYAFCENMGAKEPENIRCPTPPGLPA